MVGTVSVAGAGLSATAAVALAASRALACPGCIEGSAANVQAGFMWSGLLMMATPYFVLAVVGGGLFLAYRRSVRREVESLIGEAEADDGRERPRVPDGES